MRREQHGRRGGIHHDAQHAHGLAQREQPEQQRCLPGKQRHRQAEVDTHSLVIREPQQEQDQMQRDSRECREGGASGGSAIFQGAPDDDTREQVGGQRRGNKKGRQTHRLMLAQLRVRGKQIDALPQ